MEGSWESARYWEMLSLLLTLLQRTGSMGGRPEKGKRTEGQKHWRGLLLWGIRDEKKSMVHPLNHTQRGTLLNIRRRHRERFQKKSVAVFFPPAAEILSLLHDDMGENVFRPVNKRNLLHEMDLSVPDRSAFEKVDCTVCVYIEGHFDKSAACWTPGDQVRLYLDGPHLTDLRKNISEPVLRNIGRQIFHRDSGCHV